MIVIGPGQREGLLLQFAKPGNYTIRQVILNDFEGEEYNPDLPAATIIVNTECAFEKAIDVSALAFTPGNSFYFSVVKVHFLWRQTFVDLIYRH